MDTENNNTIINNTITNNTIKSIADIKNAYYINLEKRKDRKAHLENELDKIGIKAERFNAIELPNGNGALGCSMSHLKCIEKAKQNNWDHILVMEDDITFLDSELFTKQLNKFLKINKVWDVILLAGNVYKPYIQYGDYCVKVFRSQTATGYIVKNTYYDKLIQNYKEGINNLIKEPTKANQHAIDKHWFRLQEQDSWFLITPLTVIQNENFSDIEKREVNYKSLMTNLDKEFSNKY
uniref:Glycosyl transferase family 25 domain-containing protein n=1 Tax=viral metagenome TaxID=1070528 RepID=A0A6C0IFI0_9ZZZZ